MKPLFIFEGWELESCSGSSICLKVHCCFVIKSFQGCNIGMCVEDLSQLVWNKTDSPFLDWNRHLGFTTMFLVLTLKLCNIYDIWLQGFLILLPYYKLLFEYLKLGLYIEICQIDLHINLVNNWNNWTMGHVCFYSSLYRIFSLYA